MSAWTSKYALLVRRELWEHRALWRAPVIVAVAVIVMALFGGQGSMIRGTGGAPPLDGGVRELQLASQLFGNGVMTVLMLVLGCVAGIATFAYLLDCLYAERKDRSILFWKSLPVSDAETVLAKVAVAVVLVPLVTAVVAIIAQPLMLGALSLRFEMLRPAIGFESVLGGYKALPELFLAWVFAAMWYAPFVAYLLLASVLAKRVPLMYALMPPGVLILMEPLLLGSIHVARFVGGRLAPWSGTNFGWDAQMDGAGRVIGLGNPDWSVILQSPDLWLGLAATAAMVYIVIRLRRYRDDT
jgi:ABC-2 type transport system permease protein